MYDQQQAPLTLTFDAMSQALIHFNKTLSLSNLPMWLPLSESEIASNISMKSKAIEIFADIWHSQEGDGRHTISCHGLIGANAALLAAAEQLNSCKQAFQHALAQLKSKDPKAINLVLQSRSQILAAALHREGLSRLHLKQCYRQIPLLHAGCTKVHFSWYSSGRSIKRITIEESLEKLLKLSQSSQHIQIQINALSNLRPGTRLAQVQSQVPIMRANAVWPVQDAHQNQSNNEKQTVLWLRKARNAPLPLLVPLSENEALPIFNQPALTPPPIRSRAQRSDSVIETEPLLPSLRIHCYKT